MYISGYQIVDHGLNIGRLNFFRDNTTNLIKAFIQNHLYKDFYNPKKLRKNLVRRRKRKKSMRAERAPTHHLL